MEKFIRIESTLINVNTITNIHPNVFNDTACIIIDTNDGANHIKYLPKHIDMIDNIIDTYIDLITTFLASKEPDELVLDLNTYASGNMNENETKSESTENCCENCAYLGARDDFSKFCMIYDKELFDTACDTVCDLYKSIETYNTEQAERTERTKLREAVQLLQTYCAAHQGNCKGCLFSDNYKLGCPLAQLPEDWNTDCLM